MSERRWVLDERVGCVAIYRGPGRDCLGDNLANDPDCVFFVKGEYVNREWSVPEEALARARRCYAALVAK